MNHILRKITACLLTAVILLGPGRAVSGLPDDGAFFRNQTIAFIRQAARPLLTNQPVQIPKALDLEGDWNIALTLYDQGEIVGQGRSEGKRLGLALEEAVKNTIRGFIKTPPAAGEFAGMRFHVAISRPALEPVSFIEYNGEGKELAGDVVAIRHLDKNIIREKIEAGGQYLLRMMHKEKHGFYKRYDVQNNRVGDRLRTIYSASSLFTLLKIHDLNQSPEIAGAIPQIADFLLEMQNKEKAHHGAFYYAYFVKTGEKQLKFVVGTASKTIFTLLQLYQRTREPKYLESARAAGNWLLTMQNPDGSVINQVKHKNGEWVFDKRYSCLYTGQVLSALSRLYAATSDKRYYEGALKIARQSAVRARAQGYFMKDDYRLADDPVPTSWVVMSLLDFYKISGEQIYRDTFLKCSAELLKRQNNDAGDIMKYGRWQGSTATSGNGWINEILVEVLRICKETSPEEAGKYKDAIVKVTRWLIQNTYSAENTYFLRNPERAFGGLIRNPREESVRTDAVCHGGNGYIGLLEELEDGWSFDVPEKRYEDSVYP